jgi:hypothetical protein
MDFHPFSPVLHVIGRIDEFEEVEVSLTRLLVVTLESMAIQKGDDGALFPLPGG